MIVIAAVSVLIGTALFCVSGNSWRRWCVKDEAVRLTQWLTNRYQRSIMYGRFFSLIISEHGLFTDRISLRWYSPTEEEIFKLKHCILSRTGAYREAIYKPSYRTLSPGMTLQIFTEIKSPPVGKIVLPVKGIPYMEWFVH